MSISGRFICRPCFYPRICKHPGRCTHWWDKPGVLQVWGAAEPSLLQLGVEMTSYKLFIYFLLLSFSLILLWYILNFHFFKALVFLRSHSGCVFSFYDIPTSVIEVWFFFNIKNSVESFGKCFYQFSAKLRGQIWRLQIFVLNNNIFYRRSKSVVLLCWYCYFLWVIKEFSRFPCSIPDYPNQTFYDSSSLDSNQAWVNVWKKKVEFWLW